MVIAFLLLHFAPSIYWGATHNTIAAPLLWSLVGAAYSAIVKWRTQDADLISAHAFATGRGKSMVLGAALGGLLFSGALNVVGYFIGKAFVESASALRVLEAIGFGYLLAGLHQVLCDLRHPPIGQPAYIRAGSTSIPSLTLGVLGWLPVSFVNLRWARGRAFLDTIFSWVTFVAVTCVLLLL
jgi:hypothetical protein